VLLVAACGGGEAPRARRTIYDLVARFAVTEGGGETTVLELADRRSRPRLTRGWSDPQVLPSGESVVLGTERFSTVRIDLAKPMDRTLILRCAHRGPPSAPPARIAVLLNNRRFGVFPVGPAMEDLRVQLPARLQRPGRNEFTVSGPPARRGKETGIAYHSIRLDGPVDPRRPRLEDDAILLPEAATLRYLLRVPSDGLVTLAPEPQDAPLSAVIQPEGEREQDVELDAGPDGTLVGDLSPWREQIVRLSIRYPGGRGPVRVRAPRVLGTADPVAPPPGEGRRANVLLYVIDTLRADHLGCYGYAKSTSPHIDALARDAAVFQTALAQASWTRPAMASLFTGVDPPVHGAMTLRQGFRPEVPTLTESLAAAGYETAAFVTNVNVAGRWGFGRGFDVYEYLPEDETSETLHVRSDVLTARAREWLDRADPSRPFFLYVHATDPHSPYAPPDDLARIWANGRCGGAAKRLLERVKPQPSRLTPDELRQLIACYDAEIVFNDRSFGALVADLARRRRLDDTIVVVTADHGEEFLDHRGLEHGRTLYDELLRIPLVMRFPDAGLRARRVEAVARQIDVMPTLLAYLGLPLPAEVRGRSLLGAIAGDRPEASVEAYAYTQLGGRSRQSITVDRWKVIESERNSVPLQIFDLGRDPAERVNRAPERPWLAEYAREAFAMWLAELPRTPADGGLTAPPEADAETMRRLRALGYVE